MIFWPLVFKKFKILFKQPAIDVITIGEQHQRDQDHKSNQLGVLHELLIWLSTGHHFVQQEHHVATVKCGNWKNVHECQNNRNKGSGHPECLPVPRIGEKAANSAKPSNLRSAFFGEDVFKLGNVIVQGPISQIKTFLYTFRKRIILPAYLNRSFWVYRNSELSFLIWR